MLNIFKKIDGQLLSLDDFVEGCWTHLCDPIPEEINKTIDFYQLDPDFIHSSLDEEESAHIEFDDKNTLVVVDIPIVEAESGRSIVYTTLPMGVVLCPMGILTICSRETTIIDDFMQGRVKTFSTNKQTRFLLQILYKNASKFLQYLKQIDKASSRVETELHKSMKNRELIQMLRLEKALVYFSTSLKGNEVVLEKLLKAQTITRYSDDEDLLEDVIIENKQAIEMCTIYRDILGGTMDAYASVISNNLNIAMKLLAVITIILAVPQIIFSLWGMNVDVPWSGSPLGFWYIILVSAVLAVAASIFMWWKKMF